MPACPCEGQVPSGGYTKARAYVARIDENYWPRNGFRNVFHNHLITLSGYTVDKGT